MPETNPLTPQIEKLAMELLELKAEGSATSGSQATAIETEIKAKESILDKLLIIQEAWMLGRLKKVVADLETLAASELAYQARIVKRLRNLVEALGGTVQSSQDQSKIDVAAETGTGIGLPDKSTAPVGPSNNQGSIAVEPLVGGYVRIEISPQDFDALCRVTQSEVGHFAKYGNDQLEGGVSAVVETIINRTAHKGYPATIQEVVDQPSQFSAINKLGTWAALPDSTPAIEVIVQNYLEARVAGEKGILQGATHFLNPHFSSKQALSSWGNHVVLNAVAKYGSDEKKDVHFHGFAPGTPLPEPYVIKLGSWSPVFSGRGAPSSSGAFTGFRNALVDSLKAELERFGNGKLKEGDAAVYKRVGNYWEALGLPYNGRSKVKLPDGTFGNPAWSAAFVSWVIKQRGVGKDRFIGAQAHWKYFKDLVDGSLANPLFEVKDPLFHTPQPGDILHYGRGSAKKFDLAAAKDYLKIDGFYPSHSDFVVEVDSDGSAVTTVGGNVDNSVKSKRPKLDANGLLVSRKESGADYPWIAVLSLREA